MNSIVAILVIYLPLGLMLLGLIAIIQSKKLFEAGIPVNLWIFSFTIPVKNETTVKALLSTLTIVTTLAFYLFILDLSWFYPKEMNITVHYDDIQGIANLLDEINIDKIGNYPIVNDDTLSRIKYFNDGDTTIRGYLGYENYFTDAVITRKHSLVTAGTATFKVSKIRGIHTYQIVNSSGELYHIKQFGNNTQKLKSDFDHVKSPYDKIKVSKPLDILRKVITPEFRQSLLLDGRLNEMVDHTLYGITVLYPLPIPHHSNTLYLVEKEDKMIPIGYAEYN